MDFGVAMSTVEKHVNTRLAGIFVVSMMVALSGCASMSADECVTSDWRGIGFDDGARGYTAGRLSQHRKACAKHGVSPDLQAYQEGRADGLREYCQPQRGFNLGAGGGQYNGVCAIDLEADFLDAFRSGSQLHTMRSNVNSTNHQINAKRHELDDIAASMRVAEAGLIAAETTIQDRILLLADLKDFAERTGRLESEIEALIQDRGVYEQQLASYQAVLADTGY